MSSSTNDGIDSQTLTIIALFGAAVTFVLIIGVQVLFYRMQKADFQHKVIEAGCADLKAAVTEQHAQLDQYKWVDRDKGRVMIPIERAMDLTVRELKGAKAE